MTRLPQLLGPTGAVSSTHWLATSVAAGILQDGGNAFDAAVAAGFTLQVVEPHLNGPAGEVPIIARPAGREPEVICGQGKSPAAANAQYFSDQGLELIPGTGLLAACVPGAFDGWLTLLERHGTRSLRDVLSPAIGYARHGHPLVPQASATIATVEDLMRQHWQSSAEIYLPQGAVPVAGQRFTNTALADMYDAILVEAEQRGPREVQIGAARRAFYQGFVAERIDRFSSSTAVLDSTGVKHIGLLRGSDLAEHHTPVEKSSQFMFNDFTVHKTGPWGQGPVFLQQLALLAQFDLAETEYGSAEYLHTVIECLKLAFADREAWYGDPDFVNVPLDDLLGVQYSQQRAALVGPTASTELRPGRPGNREPRLAQHMSIPRGQEFAGAGEPTMQQFGPVDGDTCHVDVTDRWGNMVSATPSGGWLQSSPVIPGLGFGLGTRAQMFWLEQGLPNSLRPGKRPRTTLSPGLAERDGEPYMAFGTPGGDGQDQWSLFMFLAHAVHGKSLRDAMDAPTVQSLHFPSSFHPRGSTPAGLTAEGRMPENVVADLAGRGHEVTLAAPWSLGRLCAVRRVRDTDMNEAVADTRSRQAYAVAL